MMTTKVLPALRGFMAQDRDLPRLERVEPDGTEPAVSIPSDCNDVLAVLRDRLPADARRVTIESLGTYAAVSATAKDGHSKIAVVTGAAQGFGLEIATDLAAQGAWWRWPTSTRKVSRRQPQRLMPSADVTPPSVWP